MQKLLQQLSQRVNVRVVAVGVSELLEHLAVEVLRLEASRAVTQVEHVVEGLVAPQQFKLQIL